MPAIGTETLKLRVEELSRRVEELSLYQVVVDHAPDGIVVTDADDVIIAINPAFSAITGFSADEVVGRPAVMLTEGELNATSHAEMRETLAVHGRWKGDIVAPRSNGHLATFRVSISNQRDGEGKVARRIAIFRDVTAARETTEQLWRRSNFDPLTELPNRSLFLDRLLQALVMAGRENSRVALLFIGLDGFKNINDSLGHWIGDKVLQDAARRFQAALRQGDTAARFGGDEFTVVLANIRAVEEVEGVLRTILEALQEPFVIEQHHVLISCSIGICLWPGDGEDVEALMRNATSALQQAKQAGRNTFRFFTPAMDARAQARSRLADELAGALEGEEFHLVFQPLVDLKTGEVTAAETLLRWHNRYLGVVSPEQFVPLAEELGLIRPIGEWLLMAACHEALRWQSLGLGDIGVAVNISPRQFQQGDILQIIERALSESGLEPRLLTIEITEGLLLTNSEEVIAKLESIRALGVTLSVDDFGTGYSSLSYLKTLPVDVLKIDRSFIADMLDNLDDATLVDAIIAMGHSMRLEVVAEGIETEDQLVYLAEHGCNSGQGYHFSPPLSPGRFRDFVLSRSSSNASSPSQVFDSCRGTAPAGIRVLFADDVDLVRLVFRDFLDGTGCIIHEARDGAEAVEKFRAARMPYDLIVLDLYMPGTDGFEAAKAIRALETKGGLDRTPIIALTAGNSEEERWKAKDSGFDRFLSKPIARTDLLEAMAEMLPPEMTDSAPAAETLAGLNIPPGLEHLLPNFIQEMIKDQQRLRDLADLSDRKELAEHVHAMRGKCGMFGEEVLFDLLTRLEAQVASGKQNDITALLAKVVERIGRL
ncbi:EAL domain-containing protein [Paramagnetospirillum kuznetsovii]|uniref:EAL domain-containing protein n=1 Tax=Paramagnetospirillum kuznetsovii TaxID=2053833 RepID=UPI001EFDDBDD|nr:EAL domain-containing protein [Paramagnetospirillum kuznetsovii]